MTEETTIPEEVKTEEVKTEEVNNEEVIAPTVTDETLEVAETPEATAE